MPVLSIAQALTYARKAGFSGDNASRMVAICMCESGLNTHPPDNTTGNSAGRDRGLCQINSYYHNEISDACAYDPQCAMNAAYGISGFGTNFSAWSTFNNGCSQTKMAQVQKVANTGSLGGTTGGLKPWYQFPRVDNYGGTEPFGGFAKPDSNIQIPADYPITALLPGTVTALDTSNVAWGAAITIKLDTAYNSIATHTAYIHLSRYTVKQGQHVNAGDLIGYNGSGNAAGTQKVPLGFALYNGDHYGVDATWSKYLGSASLNPVPLLNSAATGTLNIPDNSTPSSGGTSIINLASTTITSVSERAQSIINTVPGFLGICESLDAVETFVPFVFPSSTNTAAMNAGAATAAAGGADINIFGWDTGLANPWAFASAASQAVQLPADTIQAALIFATSNFSAFAVRSLFVIAGVVLFYALMINLISQFIDVKDVSQAATAIAPMLV